MDLGDYVYKQQLWNQLWNFKYRAIENAEQHEASYIFFKRIREILDITISMLTSGTAIVAGTNNDKNHYESSIMIIIFSVSAVLLKIIEKSTGISECILHYNRTSQNYKYLHEEIRRIMTIKRTTAEFKEAVDILSDLFIIFEQNAIPVLGFIRKKYMVTVPPIPDTPSSPNSSRNYSHESNLPNSSSNVSPNFSNESKLFDWNELNIDFPLISENNDLAVFYNIPDNIGRYMNNNTGAVIKVNEACCRLVGATFSDIVSPSGFGWSSRLHRNDASYIWERWQNCVRNQHIFFEKYRFVHSDNEIIYVVAEAYPLFSRTGIFEGMYGIIVSISKTVWDVFSIIDAINSNV